MARVVVEVAHRGKLTYQREMVRCGKKRCKSCPHGPYWYSYWWSPDLRRMVTRYIGKKLPEFVAAELRPGPTPKA